MESQHTWIIPGKQVWLRQNETFIEGVVANRDEKAQTATCRAGSQQISVPFTDVFEYAHTQKEYADMCNMDVLNEPQILSNLHRRYRQDRIFTKIGPTLIVVNPYKIIDPLFNHKKMKELTDKVKASEKIDTLDPHVFLIAGAAYNKLRIGNQKQAIVISGESGAGKTENAKYCMAFLAGLSHQHHDDEKKLAIEDKILDCNPVLEAFGNSKTVRNSNSSRFGKYVRLYLNGLCSIKGARIESYLLEKSRVVSVAQQERNFHVFYCLQSHPSRIKYGLLPDEKYAFLEQSGCYEAEGINDKQNFECVDDSLKKVGFSDEEVRRIWEVVACILLLGNLRFDDAANLQNSGSCTFTDKVLAERVQKLLKVPNLERVMLEQRRMSGKEEIVFMLSRVQCENNRNTLAKALYNRMFDYIIEKMNERLSVKQEKYNSIGLLDIFGFENFLMNSFEQLCINFTNEKLQKLYTRYVFETELEEIKRDGLGDRVKDITPPDNRSVIELIEKKKAGLSIFGLIDDKTSLQTSKDEDIVADMRKEFGDAKKGLHRNLLFSLTSKNTFTIVHTQSNVTYTVDGFRGKNEDKVTREIDGVLDSSFPLDAVAGDTKNKTIVSKFDVEVKLLMQELEGSEVHFVRCIKPNELKVKEMLDEAYTLKQVRYLGVLETIKIRKSTFPYRKPYKQFVDTLSQVVTVDKSLKNDADRAKFIISKLFPGIEKDKQAYLTGNERIYLSSEYETKLNELMLQKFKRKQECAVKVQRQWRVYRYRKVVMIGLKKLVKALRRVRELVAKKLEGGRKLYIKNLKETAVKVGKTVKDRKQEEKLKKQREKEAREKEAKAVADKAKHIERLKKLEACFPKFAIVVGKYQKFLFFTKLRYYKKPEVLNETIILNETMYDTVVHAEDYNKQIELQRQQEAEKNRPKEKKVEENQFGQSFLDEKSILQAPSDHTTLRGQIRVGRYNRHPGLKKLREIIEETYKADVANEDEYYSPPSIDCTYDINSLPSEIANRIVNFDYVTFFDGVLRERKTLFGRKKSCSETLVAKDAPITKSLMLLAPDEERRSIECFKLILRLSEEQRIEKVFKLVQQIIELLQDSSQILKNEVFTQFIKQQNTKSELSAIRIYQMITIYLHVFKPDESYLLSALNIFYSKLTAPHGNKKENEYLQYLFPRMLRLVTQQSDYSVEYMPAQYQMMALMCKRQISMPIFFSVGNSIIVRVESHETFADIKERVLKEVGIDTRRLYKQLFGFFEIMNFQNEELQEAPIDDSRNVWDLLTYWERAKDKFEEGKIKPPLFIMMLKIRYAYECDIADEESIELFYAQCYFDLFIGRLKPDLTDVICAVAALRLINSDKAEEATSMIPMWVIQKHKPEEITKLVADKQKDLAREKMTNPQLKFFFVRMCDHSKLCMAMSIPTEQQIQLFLRPKRIVLAEKGIVHEEFSIRRILKWSTDDETLMLNVAQQQGSSDGKTIVIRTRHAQIVSKYLSLAAKLIMRPVAE